MRSTAVTANGRRLNGLVRRRKEEARLIALGDYGHMAAATTSQIDDIKEYQKWLKTLGYYKGTVDGRRGDLTIGAVKNFQRANDLVVDGVVGPATRAALIRALDAKTTVTTTAAGGGGSGVAGGALTAPEPVPSAPDALPADPSVVGDMLANGLAVGVVVAAVIFISFIIYSNRRRIFGGDQVL